MNRDEADRLSHAAAAFARALAGDDSGMFVQHYMSALNLAEQAVGDDDSAVGAALSRRLVRTSYSGDALGGNLRTSIESQPASSLYQDNVWLQNALHVIESDTRIVGGQETNDFPDCVAIGSGDQWCCTGTLVSPNVVVTAGHCVRGGCMERVFTGPDVTSANGGRVVQVLRAVMHPQYEPPRSDYSDIAVLILSEDITEISPRAIAPQGALEGAGSVRLVGYGTTDVQGTIGYGLRREVDVPMASASLPLGHRSDIEFVAGRPFLEKDSCRGDSGGPAYVQIRDDWLLVGATSRAVPGRRTCGDGGIYTLVPAFEGWIRSVDGGHWNT